MFQSKLISAIRKYLDLTTTRPTKSAAKGVITRLVNAASTTDLMLIPEILKEFDDLPDWLKLRFQKGSLYQDGDRVFGWCRDDQVQAVCLPVVLDVFYADETRNCPVKYIRVISSEQADFAPPVVLPFDGFCVSFPFDDPNFLALLECGWAPPCDLQWSWSDRPRWSSLEGSEGYVVERSIISHGFWQAWKWWPGCWRWYIGKRPELFEAAEWWGTPDPEPPIRYDPPNNPFAAVLGGSPEYQQKVRQRLLVISDKV